MLFYRQTCSYTICDFSTYIIEGRTSVTQIRGAGLKRERGQQRGRFTSHVVKSMLASSDCARKGEHDPRPSVFLGELRCGAALCSL